jgi:hypothetical protein
VPREVKREQCPVAYSGPSFPALRGTRCRIDHHPHANVRHWAVDAKGKSFWWWTPEEKEAIRG